MFNFKKILSVFIFWIIFIGTSYWKTNCDNTIFQINWFDEIKQNQISKYGIENLSWDVSNILNTSINYKLTKNGRILNSFIWEEYVHNFTELGTYVLNVSFSDKNSCNYNLKKTIKSYKNSLIYIWTPTNEIDTWLLNSFNWNSILLAKIILSDQRLFSEDEIIYKMTEMIDFIKSADQIILNSYNFDVILQVISKLNTNNTIDFSEKKIYISSKVDKNFIKRTLSKYIKNLWIQKVYILDDNYIPLLLSKISNKDSIENQSYIKEIPLSIDGTPAYYPISYFVDYLIFKWLPINLIALLLILSVWALLISIFRQIIWFSVFGIFSPLLFTVSIYVLDVKPALFLFLIAFISTLITRIFTKRIYLLYSAKVSLLVILYFLMTIIILWLDKAIGTNFIDLSIFNNTYIIFPIIFLIFVNDKIFSESFKLLSVWWWFSFIEFLIVSFGIYGLMSWNALKHVLLSYPELILVVFLLNIAVGRFTWLQLLEYFRFMPLIRKHLEWEEEE